MEVILRRVSEPLTTHAPQILRNSRVDTEFSGTTLSMAIIRGNTIIGVNIGDSRVTIGKLGPEGKIISEEVSGWRS